MQIVNFTPVAALVGGALIGLAASLFMFGTGRIAGISGVVGGLFRPKAGDVAWRLSFLGGLLAGGLAAALLVPGALHFGIERSTTTLIIAGLLVGIGTRVGNGCTSGHGVCGISRFSTRSIVATATFITTGMISVGVMKLFGGDA